METFLLDVLAGIPAGVVEQSHMFTCGSALKGEMFMSIVTFDTLGYTKKLENAGFTRNQAEAQALALREVIEDKIATKQDIREMELRLKYDLTIRLGGIVVACTAILLAILPLLLQK